MIGYIGVAQSGFDEDKPTMSKDTFKKLYKDSFFLRAIDETIRIFNSNIGHDLGLHRQRKSN